MYFIELWLIFRKFRSYEHSELQVHKNIAYAFASFAGNICKILHTSYSVRT